MGRGTVFVREAMKTNPVTVGPKTSVKEAAQIMKQKALEIV